MKPKLYIVTGNALKFRELSHALSELFDCEQKDFKGEEIQGTAEEIINHKLHQVYGLFKHPVLVDDTSVEFEKMLGLPGPYFKYLAKLHSQYEIGLKLEGSRVKVTAWLGFYDGIKEPIIVEGSIEGVVVKPKKEYDETRAFDLFIQVDGTDKPMIEFTPEEKNKFSHRGKAMRELISLLEKRNK